MNTENFGLTDEQFERLTTFIEAGKKTQELLNKIIPATPGEVEAIEIAYQLQRRIDKAIQVLDQNPGVLSSLIRDILSVDVD